MNCAKNQKNSTIKPSYGLDLWPFSTKEIWCGKTMYICMKMTSSTNNRCSSPTRVICDHCVVRACIIARKCYLLCILLLYYRSVNVNFMFFRVFKSRQRDLFCNLMRRVRPRQEVKDIKENILIHKVEKIKGQVLSVR